MLGSRPQALPNTDGQRNAPMGLTGRRFHGHRTLPGAIGTSPTGSNTSMKRALIWLSWGGRHVAEAIESARTANSLDADRILITDRASMGQVQGAEAFTAVAPLEPVYGNNLEKSRLVDLLPTGYESFLFRDSDTHILDDLSLGNSTNFEGRPPMRSASTILGGAAAGVRTSGIASKRSRNLLSFMHIPEPS